MSGLSIQVEGDAFHQGGSDLPGELASREGSHEFVLDKLGWGCLGGIKSRCGVGSGTKESGGRRRGLAGDIYKSGRRQPGDDVYIHGNALDHSGSSAAREPRRGPRTRLWEATFSCWVEKQQRGHRRNRTESDMMATHRVKGLKCSVWSLAQRALHYHCCMLIMWHSPYGWSVVGSK